MKVFGIERDYIIHDEKNVKGFFGDYRFLSNYHVADVYFEGIKYPSAENAYHAAKSLDPFVRQQMVDLRPDESKKLGRKIQIRPNWDQIKYEVMCSIIFDKFYRHPELRGMLTNTADKYLEETNHWGDQYWGVYEGKGENRLGRILMSVRDFWNTQQLNEDQIYSTKALF